MPALRPNRLLQGTAFVCLIGAATLGAPTDSLRAQAPALQDAVAPAATAAPPTVFGPDDDARLAALSTGLVARVIKGRGGRSLSFRITLQDGTEGYFKPEQSFSAAHYWGELASYYLDRELGFGRVPPAVGRQLGWHQLRRAAGTDHRVRELAVDRQGHVRGAFIWWVPEGLERWRLPRGWERAIRMFHGLDITPYQRPSDLRAMRAGERRYYEANDRRRPSYDDHPLTDEQAASLSDLILFDYLTHNADRWGGMFTNVRTRGENGPLTFMDNGASFPLAEQHSQLLTSRLRAVQRFRRSTIDAIRRLDVDSLVERMSRDPLAPILNDRQLEGLRERQRRLLRHVERMHGRFGDRIFAW